MPKAAFKWAYESGSNTGVSTAVFDNVGIRDCLQLTVQLICGAGGTCSFGIEAGTDSTSGFARMGSTAYELSSASQMIVQFSGPVEAIRPYLIARTDSATFTRVILHGN